MSWNNDDQRRRDDEKRREDERRREEDRRREEARRDEQRREEARQAENRRLDDIRREDARRNQERLDRENRERDAENRRLAEQRRREDAEREAQKQRRHDEKEDEYRERQKALMEYEAKRKAQSATSVPTSAPYVPIVPTVAPRPSYTSSAPNRQEPERKSNGISAEQVARLPYDSFIQYSHNSQLTSADWLKAVDLRSKQTSETANNLYNKYENYLEVCKKSYDRNESTIKEARRQAKRIYSGYLEEIKTLSQFSGVKESDLTFLSELKFDEKTKASSESTQELKQKLVGQLRSLEKSTSSSKSSKPWWRFW